MKKVISTIFTLIIMIALVGAIIFVYNRFYFNDFSKAQEKDHITSFYRESKVKFNNDNSYCIENTDFNDAIFFKEVTVEKNTPYKVTCMVKTENVESTEPETSGACISVLDTIEQTTPLQGTNDWKRLTLYFDSQNSESMKIGFRLGGYNGYTKGKVWFSDIHLEKGAKDADKTWNVACFFINNVEFTADNNKYSYSLTDEDKILLKDNLQRFEDTCEKFSNSAMKVSTNIIEIDKPLKTFSYDAENYYYVSPKDVEPLIDDYVKQNEFDHIFIGIRMGNEENAIPVKDWIGLGSMKYDSIGFSNIRMPNDMNRTTMYKYDIQNDTFPEEVFVHEFLHSLERNLSERQYKFPALHDNEKFGYKSSDSSGLKNWYRDYMRNEIKTSDGKTGLDSLVYSTKPLHESNFNNASEMEFENKPNNIVDIAVQIFKNFKNIITTRKEENNNYYDYNSTIITD